MEEKKLTGYPSIDKPWLKYYSDEAIKASLPECTMYEYLWESNKDHLGDVALDYLGNKITYRVLFSKIESAAKSFINLGVRAGDIVPIMAVNMPEVVYSIYGLNRIGAIPNMIDPRTGSAGLKAYVSETGSKFLLALDVCHTAVNDTLGDADLSHIIVLSVADSLPFPLKQVMRHKYRNMKIKESPNVLSWKQFSKLESQNQIGYPSYEKNQAAIIVHTGGTTGVPKGVVLSNDNLNAVAHQVKYTRYEIMRQDRFLNILVPFVAYGVALGMHAPLSLGWKSILIPKFDPKDIVRLMKKHTPAAVMGIATYFEPLLKENSFDFSKCKAILMGGMPTKATFEQKLNKFIAEGNGNFMVSKGYSMTEASSTATSSQNGANEIGSNGIPLVNTVVAAFDTKSGNELPYGELGELCILSPTQMLEYYDKPEETAKVLRRHPDGKVWIHSGDVGYVTSDGFVYVVDRIKRMIIRSGFKVFPSEIENVFLKHFAVKSCAVIGVEDAKDTTAPFAYIVLKDGIHMDETTILNDLSASILDSGLPPYFTPVGFAFRTNLPLTSAGKVDYRALEKEATGLANAN